MVTWGIFRGRIFFLGVSMKGPSPEKPRIDTKELLPRTFIPHEVSGFTGVLQLEPYINITSKRTITFKSGKIVKDVRHPLLAPK